MPRARSHTPHGLFTETSRGQLSHETPPLSAAAPSVSTDALPVPHYPFADPGGSLPQLFHIPGSFHLPSAVLKSPPTLLRGFSLISKNGSTRRDTPAELCPLPFRRLIVVRLLSTPTQSEPSLGHCPCRLSFGAALRTFPPSFSLTRHTNRPHPTLPRADANIAILDI